MVVRVNAVMVFGAEQSRVTAGYLFGLLGAVVVVAGAAITSVPLLFLGMGLFGGALASGMQARFAATDLAAPNRIGQDLSIVLWMSAIGAVIGPTLVGPASATAETLGFPSLSGIFLWSSIAFLLAVILLVVALRPDPLKLARREAGEDPSKPPRALSVRETFRGIRSSPPALRRWPGQRFDLTEQFHRFVSFGLRLVAHLKLEQ